MVCKVNTSYSSICCSNCNFQTATKLMLSNSSLKHLIVLNVFSKEKILYNWDIGWLHVKESVITKPCKVDQMSETTIWYTGLTTKNLFNGKSTVIINSLFLKYVFYPKHALIFPINAPEKRR